MFSKASVLAGFAAVAAANPLAYPQQLDLAALIAQGPPASAVIASTAGVITVNPSKLASAAFASITANPLPQTLITEGAANLDRRTVQVQTFQPPEETTTSTSTSTADACAARPTLASGAGPVPSPDTASAFLAFAALSSSASAAPTPSGFTNSFTNLQGENSAYGYMGYTLLNSYDTEACAAQCTSMTGCQAINVAFERAPSVDPGTGCTNPASTTLIKCVFWGSPVNSANAVNTGGWRADFQVVVAGSNGYVTKNHAQTVPGYTLDSDTDSTAINAPLDCNNKGSYMGYVSWNDGAPFSVARCAAACTAQTAYNVAHPPSDGSAPLTCQFVNTYYLMKNGFVQAQVCSMYTQTWGSEFLTNTGYFYGSDVYTIASSVTYSNTTAPGVCVAN